MYNDAAVAIAAVLDAGAQRVAYVDLDAHHGDGVERAFWDDDRVLTISVHQHPGTLFPGTGYAQDLGGPAARGTAVNVPLPPGTGDAAWLRAVDGVVAPLVEQFAPHLLRLDARVHVLLVGAGTEALDATAAGSGPSNVQGLGFVTQERLEHLLRTCVAVLSPVVHGSGIKIKVLQSFAAGCPVFATEESLRGFEFMGVPPRLRLDDPQTGAAELVQFANSVEQQQSERAQVESAWRSYAALRRGRLVGAVAAQLV